MVPLGARPCRQQLPAPIALHRSTPWGQKTPLTWQPTDQRGGHRVHKPAARLGGADWDGRAVVRRRRRKSPVFSERPLGLPVGSERGQGHLAAMSRQVDQAARLAPCREWHIYPRQAGGINTKGAPMASRGHYRSLGSHFTHWKQRRRSVGQPAQGTVGHCLCPGIRRARLSQPGQGRTQDRAGRPYRQAQPALHGAGRGL